MECYANGCKCEIITVSIGNSVTLRVIENYNPTYKVGATFNSTFVIDEQCWVIFHINTISGMYGSCPTMIDEMIVRDGDMPKLFQSAGMAEHYIKENNLVARPVMFTIPERI